MAKKKEDGFLEQLQAIINQELAVKKASAKQKAKHTASKLSQAEEYIKDHPFQSLGAAFLLGYFMGNMRRR